MRPWVSAVLLAAALAADAAETGYRLDRSPHDPTDRASLQAGAALFVNYCLGCHGAQYVRYNRLADLGLSEQQIRDNLLYTADKVGEPMRTTMPPAEARRWFGIAPPDLSLVARARGADWLYTYLRTFYRDTRSANGWNNAVFPNVGMPHALWMLQGERALENVPPQDGRSAPAYRWRQLAPGLLSEVEYDRTVRDLVNFLVWAGEPAASARTRIGVVVLVVLSVLLAFAYALKKEFWKDVR